MRITSIAPNEFDARLTGDELGMIHNALNEVCNGVEIAEFEFQTRLGWARVELRRLLDEAHAALNSN